MSIKTLIEVATEEIIKENATLPPRGEVWYNEKGKIICHICGKSFDKLTTHLVQVHDMNASEYKITFGLKNTQKLTSKGLEEYFRVNNKNLITKYSNRTKFKKGIPSVRKGTKARLQVLIERPIEYNKKKK